MRPKRAPLGGTGAFSSAGRSDTHRPGSRKPFDRADPVDGGQGNVVGLGHGLSLPGSEAGDEIGWARSASPAGPCSNPNTIESASASQDASMTFSDTPMVVHVRSPSVESIRTRVTAPVPLAGVEHPDLEVGQMDVGQLGVDRADGLAQGGVEGVDRTVALGGGDHPLVADDAP